MSTRNSKAMRIRDVNLPQMPSLLSGTSSLTPPRGRGRGRSSTINKPGAPNNRVRITNKKPTSAWGHTDKDSSHPRQRRTPTRPTTQRPPEPQPIEQTTPPPPQIETPTKSNGTETKTQSKGWSDFDDTDNESDDFFQTKLDAETLNNPPRKPPPQTRRRQPPPQSKRPPREPQQPPPSNPWGISKPPQGNIPKSSFFSEQPEYHEPPQDPIPPVVREVVRTKPRNGRGNRKRQQEQFYEEYDYQEPPQQQQTVHRRRPSKQKRQIERRFASSPCDAQPPKLEPFRRENYQRRLVEVQERLKKQNEMNQAIAERRKMLEETRKRDWMVKLQTKDIEQQQPIVPEITKEEVTGEREGEYDESYGNDDSKDWSQKSSGQADWAFPETQVTAVGTPQQQIASGGTAIPAVALGGGTNPQAQPFQPMAFGATTFQQMEQHHFPTGNGTAAQYYTPQMWGAYSDQLAQPTGSSSLSVHSQPFQPSYYGGMYDQGAAAAAALTGQYYGTQPHHHHGYYDQSYAYQSTQPIQQMQMTAAAAAPPAATTQQQQQQQHPSAQYLQQAAPQTQQHFMYQ